MIDLKKHTNIALGYFLLVGLLGVFLRFFFVTAIPANFRHVVHAHSHIALLGWVYLGLITLIYKLYFSKTRTGNTYKRIFWFTNVTLLGMLFTFPFTGYALLSITFSTLFLFASYFLAWFVIRKIPENFRRTNSFRCIKVSIWYMVFSSIGPWALGGVMATLGKTSIWYKMAIYFYLHFQYNAWFILALVGIFLYFLEKRGILFEKRHFNHFFYLLNGGIILSFFLSVLWVEPHWIYYVLAAAGAVLQILAFIKFFAIIRKAWKQARSYFDPFVVSLLKICGIVLFGKLLLQLLSAVPFFAELAFTYPDFVIGYLHWTFLGLISIALFAFLQHTGLIRLSKAAFGIYFLGFILSEVLIFYRGIGIWLRLPFFPDYFWLLTFISSLIPVAVGILLFRNLLTK